jgi:osmoprotectant transport system permease protein
MSFPEYVVRRWDHLFENTVEHALVTLGSVAIAALVGVLLGVLTYRTVRPRTAVIGVSATFLTIPSFALFGLMIAPFGLGAKPVVVALVMYSLLPIVRNTITGLREVDPAVVESARGMGMGRGQVLWRIELPLAWPIILTGIRVSTMILLGIAAIGAYVNGPGLGKDIFRGLARLGSPAAENLILGGFLGIIVLAVIFDVLFAVLNRVTVPSGVRS